jgi:hypothetical protein
VMQLGIEVPEPSCCASAEPGMKELIAVMKRRRLLYTK